MGGTVSETGRSEVPETVRESIKTVDRRHFTSDGELREGLPPEEAKPASPPESSSPRKEAGAPTVPEGGPSLFSEHVRAIAIQAAMALGAIPDPATGRLACDIEIAGSLIDLLDALREKTRGNLSSYESRALDDALGQLRILYVEARSKGAGAGGTKP
jgi:hypothetical protein